jgi:hypothetical protein
MSDATTTTAAAEATPQTITPGELRRAALEGRKARQEPQTTTDVVQQHAGAQEAAARQDDGLDAEALEALTANDGTSEETITIGGVEVPVSALTDLPDDVLRKIKRKVKAAGQEREVSLIEALEAVPKAEGWQRRMWEASQREKQLEALASRMAEDPIEAFAKLRGVTRSQALDALGSQLLADLDYESLPPAERAKRDRERELERKAALADELMRRQDEERAKVETERAQKTALATLRTAFQAHGVAETPYAIRRVASIVLDATEAGVIKGDPTASDLEWAAQEVAREQREERESYLSPDADGEALIARVGEDRARRIAQAYAARVRAKQSPVTREAPAPGKPRQQAQQQRPSTWDEWQRQADRRQGIRR